ncbi:MAG: VacJ family lipoprotein [Syntrophobacterales bacterium]|jgi:phospholipid-binding lipoprotein MlaA|nr:VacJ family lipoprotein [Syntrophobacterales bacterium]
MMSFIREKDGEMRDMRARRFFLFSVFFLGFCLLPSYDAPFLANHAWGAEEYAVEISASLPEDVLPSADLAPEAAAGEAADHDVADTAVAEAADEYEDDYFDEDEELYGVRSDIAPIADPIEPFNRAMHHFNDKMYFWVLKPVAIGYKTVVPELVRVGVKNFFTNLAFPLRFTSSLLQADFGGALRETGRFTINTVWGLAGFLDPASMSGDLFPKNDADLGETFGVWGIGPGIYIVWPVIGPSSLRDTFAFAGECFLYPPAYLQPWYTPAGVRSYQIINDTSLRIGDYEALIGAAIDPYLAARDAYNQYRAKKIENKRKKLTSPAEIPSE